MHPDSNKANPDNPRLDPPPGTWPPMRRAVRSVTRPIEDFLHIEASGGIVLLVATILALGWANSDWASSYDAFWSTRIGGHIGALELAHPLRFWVNEVLMTLFFFVVGLEVRREIARGELSDLRRAALPVAAAAGGMLVPALLYASLNIGRETMSGWAVPMATDIAFAIGVLALLGKRVPPALRILLLALAVIDDVGAVLVIGLFYSSSFDPTGLVVAGGGVLAILLLQWAGVRRAGFYVVPGLVVWEGIHSAGVHATLAGVLVGLMTPTRAWFGPGVFVTIVGRVVREVRDGPKGNIEAQLDTLDKARREAVAPVDYLLHSLHRWVAYGVMPLFAFANAGVALGAISLDASSTPLLAGIALGLVVGKPLGIVAGAALVVKLGIATLPTGVTWRGVTVVGLVGGIGFTMSLFIAELAFATGALDAAKLAILVGSAVAAIAGVAFGRFALPQVADAEGMARTESEAEASTHS